MWKAIAHRKGSVFCEREATRAAHYRKSRDQLEVERSTFSKIRDRSAMRNRLARGTAVADLRCHRRCGVQLILEGSRSTRTDPVRMVYCILALPWPILIFNSGPEPATTLQEQTTGTTGTKLRRPL